MATTTLNNVHFVVIDETKIAAKQVSIRIYDSANNLLSNLVLATDRASTSVVSILPPPPPSLAVPVSITLTPASQSLPDNSPVGTKVCSIAVKMSDGSPFTGTMVIKPGGTVGLSAGSNLTLMRALTSADDGAHNFTITATQNLVSAQAVLALNVSAVAPPPPPPPGNLMAEWSLTSASVSGTTVADASGSSNTATVVNGPLTFGAVGATFNGTNQYLDSTLSVTTSTLTISLWFNAVDLKTDNPRLLANAVTDVDNKGFQLLINSGGGQGSFQIGNGVTYGNGLWFRQLTTGSLHHYVGTYDGASIAVYLDGVQVAKTAFVGGPIAASGHINVGRNPVYAGDYFHGSIADVRLYNKALAAADVSALFNAGITGGSGPPPPPPPPATITAITFAPATPTIPDNAAVGTTVSQATVTMSDGSAFAGTYSLSDPTGLFTITAAGAIVTARAPTLADDGTHTITATATTPAGVAMSVRFQ